MTESFGESGVDPIKLKLLPDEKVGRALYLGCEAGLPYAEYLQKIGEEVIFTDIRRIEGGNIVCDAHHLPFRDKAFGITWCSRLLEHQHYQSVILSEIKRVSKSYIITYSCPDNSGFFQDPEHKLVLLMEPAYKLEDGTRVITNLEFDLPVHFDVIERKRKLKRESFKKDKLERKDVLAAKFYAPIYWILFYDSRTKDHASDALRN